MSKKPVCVRIDEELWKSFLKFVSAKRGAIWRYAGEELSFAIARYMALEQGARVGAQISTINFKFGRRSAATAELIASKLQELYPDNVKLKRSQIEKAIGQTISPDPRHFRKYIPMLEHFGVIRHWKWDVYDFVRNEIKKEAHEAILAIQQAEAK